MPPSWSVVIRISADVAADLQKWLPLDAAQRVGERQRVRVVRRAAAVAGAVDADQAAGRWRARARALPGDAGVGHRSAQAERDVLEAGRRRSRRSVLGAAL